MADNTQALIALDSQSGGALAPLVTSVNLAPLRQPMQALLMRLREAMPWVPSGLENVASRMMDLQAFPRLRAFVPGERRPAWLADEGRWQAWRALITGPYKPIASAFAAQNLALAAAETEAAARNASFWSSIAKYTGADALEKVWADFWAAIDSFKAKRASVVTSLAVANKVIAAYGSSVPAALSSQTAALTAQMNSIDSRARSALVAIPNATKEAGLGLAPLVIAGIAGGVVLTATAAIWAIVRELSSVQVNAANNAQALLMFREKADQDAAAKGLITNEQLVARRTQNVVDAAKIVDSQGAGAIGRGAGEAGKGIAMGVASVAVAALGGWLLVRYLNKKTA